VIFRSGRMLIIAGLALLTGACASSPPPAPAARNEGACFADLDQKDVQYRRLADWTTPQGCSVAQAVEVTRSAIPWNRSATMACPLEMAIWDFETNVVQPAARRYFGRPVTRITHYGTYSCRNVSSGRGRLSQHALGRAIDIAAFEVEGVGTISVLRDWRDKGPKGAFLRQVSKDSCSVFSVVLSPNHDAQHQNHLHLDIGPYRLCGA